MSPRSTPDPCPQQPSDEAWNAFMKDAATVVGAEDKLQAATADLLENPYDPGNRSQMIGLLTSPEFDDATRSAHRLNSERKAG